MRHDYYLFFLIIFSCFLEESQQSFLFLVCLLGWFFLPFPVTFAWLFLGIFFLIRIASVFLLVALFHISSVSLDKILGIFFLLIPILHLLPSLEFFLFFPLVLRFLNFKIIGFFWLLIFGHRAYICTISICAYQSMVSHMQSIYTRLAFYHLPWFLLISRILCLNVSICISLPLLFLVDIITPGVLAALSFVTLKLHY